MHKCNTKSVLFFIQWQWISNAVSFPKPQQRNNQQILQWRKGICSDIEARETIHGRKASTRLVRELSSQAKSRVYIWLIVVSTIFWTPSYALYVCWLSSNEKASGSAMYASKDAIVCVMASEAFGAKKRQNSQGIVKSIHQCIHSLKWWRRFCGTVCTQSYESSVFLSREENVTWLLVSLPREEKNQGG